MHLKFMTAIDSLVPCEQMKLHWN